MEPGTAAPDFTLETFDGERITLSELRGKRVILYFYPKDDTPGCTKQACDFRDNYGLLQKANAVVVGVSPDTVEKHVHFRDKYDLPFLLLSDPDKEVASLYGAYGEKTTYGRTSMGMIRSTFVIDPEGNIELVKRNVKATGHVERLLKELDLQ